MSVKEPSANVAQFEEDAIAIPSTYKGKAVTAVGSMRYLTSYEVKIPSSVTEISASAFENNTYVEIVDLSDFDGKIKDKAFYNSSVKIIDLGEATEIGAQAFVGSDVQILTIPATVTKIGDNAFNDAGIMEVGFAGEFPTLGATVFGDGRRGIDEDEDGKPDDKINIIAKKTAWETFVGVAMDDDHANEFNTALTSKTGLVASNMRHYSEQEMTESSAVTGFYRTTGNNENRKVVYRGLGLSAVLYDYASIEYIDMYEASHFFKYTGTELSREVYHLDYTNKTVKLLEKNAKGEIILGNVLYDYQGYEVVYYVPENIEKIAGGAVLNNSTMRFVVIGNNVTEIGPFAFAMSNLFGVNIGTGIESIGEYAFFNNEYLQQIVFDGATAPTVGTAAFCMMIGTGGIGPILKVSDLAMYGDCAIYAKYPIDNTGWWPVADKSAFVDAFNASLDELGNLLPSISGSPAIYDNYVFSTKSESGKFYSAGNKIELAEGTLTMLGTDSTGYAFISYNDENGGTVSFARYYGLPGYPADSDPKAVQLMKLTQSGYEGTTVYGKFVSENDGYTFERRGDEAGAFGEIGNDNFTFDGFGKFAFFAQTGATVEGTYTVDGNILTLSDELGTVTLDRANKSITYKGRVMTALGEGAGVYYDVSNATKLTVDGKAYSEGQKDYDGKMTIEMNGQEPITVGYVRNGNTFKIHLNGKDRSWDYSRTSSDYVFQGYFGPEDYDMQLKFKVVESKLIGAFECQGETLRIDGYYGATLGDAKGTYVQFGDSDSYLLNIGANCYIVRINEQNDTFVYVNGAESGKWYTSTSSNYAWYFDGNGNLLYHSGDKYVAGTYQYNADTKELSVVYQGQATANDEKGMIDLEKGIGTIVYYNYGNSYAGISRTPFEKTQYANSLVARYSETKNTIEHTNSYFNIFKTGNYVFVNTYGNPMTVLTLDQSSEPTCDFDYAVTVGGETITVTFTLMYSPDASSIADKSLLTVDSTVKSEDGTIIYNVKWFNGNHIIIWGNDQYKYAKGEVAGGPAETFTFVDGSTTYEVTDYGTENAKIRTVTA